MQSRRAFLSSGVAAVAVTFAACIKSSTAPTNYGPVQTIDLVVGTGTVAAAGTVVTVAYTGWLYDSSQPDDKGGQIDSQSSFPFTLGAGNVIAGWDQGIPGMKVGGTRRLIVPPSLAYGASRNGPVPPYATLVFDITLLSVTTP